ncbi:hypothetical protein Sjap_025088 [Stephania japonica]|uniref:Uncharacterized protein n=1 Tax=Stephania japonica TaxID=461633 RepID=A0AAP0E5H8_9MAGN
MGVLGIHKKLSSNGGVDCFSVRKISTFRSKFDEKDGILPVLIVGGRPNWAVSLCLSHPVRLHTRGGKLLAKLRFKAKKATEEKLGSQLDVFAAVKY